MWGVYGYFTWASYKEVIGDIKGGTGIIFCCLGPGFSYAGRTHEVV